MVMKTRMSFTDDDMTQERLQDVEPILDSCAHLRSLGALGSPEMKHAMRLPQVFVEKYINDHGITPHEFEINPDHLRRILNSSEFATFRIWQGKV